MKVESRRSKVEGQTLKVFSAIRRLDVPDSLARHDEGLRKKPLGSMFLYTFQQRVFKYFSASLKIPVL